MEFLLNEIEKALDSGLYFISLQSTLSLPDICGSLQSPDGKATKNNYITWYDTYAKESSTNAISGEDCYYFRCSCLHQGTTQNHNSSYKRIIFVAPGSRSFFHNNIIVDALNIDLNTFCKNVIFSVRKWEQQIKSDPNYIRNYENLIKLYPNGLPPYIGGIPVIS